MLQLVERGYVRGVLAKLDEIEALDARYRDFVQQARELAGQFRLEAIAELAQEADVDDAVSH